MIGSFLDFYVSELQPQQTVATIKGVFTWDEKKRQSNLVKHGLDFADAAIVYDNPAKMTGISVRQGEERYADIALVEIAGSILTLVYVPRNTEIRIISFRKSSRRERKRYEEQVR